MEIRGEVEIKEEKEMPPFPSQAKGESDSEKPFQTEGERERELIHLCLHH